MLSGSKVSAGQKIGDIDPRGIPAHCSRISDKSNSIAGGVLEAILTRFDEERKK
jgi:xanthine dehydrogenase accessory factor